MPDKEITREMVLKYLPDAQFENMFFGGLRVTTPNGGELEIHGDVITTHAGGSDVIRAFVLLCANNYGDNFTVYGPDDFIMAVMAHAAQNGIDVIPAVKDSADGCLKFFLALVTFAAVAGIVGARVGVVLGISAGTASSMFVWHRIAKILHKHERRRGQRYRNLFPEVLGTDRKADRDNAKKKGWI